MDTDGQEKERIRKEKVVFPTSGGEATNTEKIEALYTSIRSRGTEGEDGIPFPSWKGVAEYRDPVDSTSLSANFADEFPEVESLLNSRVERTVIVNEINQDKNKVLGDEINETVKLHRLERSMEESMPRFKSVVEAEQQNGGPQQKRPSEENEKPVSR